MKKTLLITKFFPPAIGGIENYFSEVCQRLEPQETVVLTSPQNNAVEFDDNQKYKIYRAEFFSGRVPPRWRHLKRIIQQIIKDEGIEQIIFGHFHPLCLLGKKIGLPYFIFGHGTDVTQIKNSWWQKYALKKSYSNNLCKLVVANSRFIFDQLQAVVGDASKIKIIYPGIDYEGLSRPIGDLPDRKKLLGFDDNDIIMLSVGRLEPEKNYAAIIRLMPELLNQVPQLKYLIIGEGSQLETLKDLTWQLGLKYNVIFLGAIKNETSAKAPYFQMSHIYLTASLKSEGFGIAYLEAAATKNAVIASKFGGVKEAVKDGETGILVDPNKPEEIRTAILKLTLDRQLWEKMSSAGQAWAQNFGWNKQMEKIKEILT
jgi:phosphatidylinositol alpha-1,6-mannosyltransferase